MLRYYPLPNDVYEIIFNKLFFFLLYYVLEKKSPKEDNSNTMEINISF